MRSRMNRLPVSLDELGKFYHNYSMGKPHGHNSGKRRRFTEAEYKMLKQCGTFGMPRHQIAKLMGIGPERDLNDTSRAHALEDMIRRDKAAQRAIAEGEAQGELVPRANLWTLANGVKNSDGSWKTPPSERMLEFLLKTRYGFKSADRLEVTGKDGEKFEAIVVQIVEDKSKND